MDWIKKNKTLSALLGVFALMSTITAGWKGFDFIKGKFDGYISNSVREEMRITPGRLEKKIASGLEMSLPETSTYLIGIIRDHKNRPTTNYFWKDVNGDLMYRYEDEKDYRPIWWKSANRYYIKFPDDSWKYCQ